MLQHKRVAGGSSPPASTLDGLRVLAGRFPEPAEPKWSGASDIAH